MLPKLLLQKFSALAIRGQAFLQEPPHRIVGGHHGRFCGRQVRGPPGMMTGSGTWTKGSRQCAAFNSITTEQPNFQGRKCKSWACREPAIGCWWHSCVIVNCNTVRWSEGHKASQFYLMTGTNDKTKLDGPRQDIFPHLAGLFKGYMEHQFITPGYVSSIGYLPLIIVFQFSSPIISNSLSHRRLV